MGENPRRSDPLTIRPYRAGDERAILTLFDAAYRDYGGYVPRDMEYWKWCILDRPGMEPENILLAVDEEGEAVAYGLLSGEGVILELAVTPDAHPDQRRQMAAALLDALEERGRTLALDTIQANLPTADEAVREAAEASGYRMDPADSLQLVVVNLAALLDSILRERARALEGMGDRPILLRIQPGRCRFLSHERILIRPDLADPVQPEPPHEAEAIQVETELVTLMGIIFQGDDPDEAVRSGKVSVTAEARALVSTLLGALALPHPWYIPHADGR